MTSPWDRARPLLIGAAILLLLAPVAAAQGGGGGRGGRGPATGRGRGVATPAPDDIAPGGYSLEIDRVIDAINRGEGPQALAAFERAATEAESRGERIRAARAHGAAAAAALRLGLFQKAIQAATRSITLFREGPVDPADAGRLASVYGQLGSAYRAAGDLGRARRVLEEGAGLAESQLQGRREEGKLAMLSRALATVAFAEGDHATALRRGTQAAQLFEDALAQLPPKGAARRTKTLHRQAALSLVVAGRALLALGRPDEASVTLDRALQHARSTGLREIEMDVLQVQGRLALARGDFAKALDLYRQGITLATQIKRPGALVWLQQGLARSLDGLGRADDALVAAREAVRLVEELRAGLGESELRTGFVEDKRGIYQHAVRLALRTGKSDEAFALAERSRARAFLDLLGSQTRLSKGTTRALQGEEARLRSRLAESEGRGQEAGDGEETEDTRPADVVEQEYRAFVEKVRQASREQASLMTVEPVTLAQIQALLPEGTALVEYLVGENESIVWVVDRKRLAVRRIPEGRPALVGRVGRFRSSIAERAALPGVEAQAQELYRLLVEPVRAELSGDRLLIVPHDVLHYLPFAALRTAGGRWLMEEYALSTLPSASVLQFLGGKAAANPAGLKALAMGNPSLGEDRALRCGRTGSPGGR